MNRNTYALMGIATLLVTNSHLEKIYPKPWLAGDGLLGNVLFFVISGYGVTLGLMKNPAMLSSFYLRRLKRIYPSVWVGVGLAVLSGMPIFSWNTLGDWFWNLFWPTDYNFIAHILLLYPALWFLAKKSAQYTVLLILVGAFCWGFVLINNLSTLSSSEYLWSKWKMPIYFWWIFHTICAFCGVYLAKKKRIINERKIFWIFITFLILYFVCKFDFSLRLISEPRLLTTQMYCAILQALATCTSVFCICCINKFNLFLLKIKNLKIMELIGSLSLQFYVLHQGVAEFLVKIKIHWISKVVLLYLVTGILSFLLFKVLNVSRSKKTNLP